MKGKGLRMRGKKETEEENGSGVVVKLSKAFFSSFFFLPFHIIYLFFKNP